MSVYSLLSKPPNIATQQGDFGFILILFIYLLLLVIPSFSSPKKNNNNNYPFILSIC